MLCVFAFCTLHVIAWMFWDSFARSSTSPMSEQLKESVRSAVATGGGACSEPVCGGTGAGRAGRAALPCGSLRCPGCARCGSCAPGSSQKVPLLVADTGLAVTPLLLQLQERLLSLSISQQFPLRLSRASDMQRPLPS